MSSLQDYLDSKYIQQLKLFAKDRKRDFVFVYVEGDEDIGFWDYALNQFGNQTKFQFLVSTNKKSVFGGEDTNGKDVLLRMQNLGPNKIVCVDADLDLIVDDYSVHTYKVREDDYVVNTTYYSIENILASEFFYVPLSRNLKIIEPIETYKNMLRWISLACLDIFLLLLSYSKEKGENKIFWFKFINIF